MARPGSCPAGDDFWERSDSARTLLLQALHKGTALRRYLHQHQEDLQNAAGMRMLGFYNARRCFREPVPEIFEAARILDRAIDAHLVEDWALAERLIRDADIPELYIWTDSIWGRHNQALHRVRKVADAPPPLPPKSRAQPRMPIAATRRALIERDGYHCRFCGIPVISESVRNRIKLRYPLALRWGRTVGEQHRAFQCMWLQYDHIVPHARGGDSSLENMVVTCAPCNFGRAGYTLAEVGLTDPLRTPVQPSDWDGLERFPKAPALSLSPR